MKVLLIIDSLTSGGKERRFVELVKGLSKEKSLTCEIVILSNIIHYNEVFDQHYPVHKIPRMHKYDPSVFYKLYSIFKNFHPDIVHSWESMATLYALPIAKMFRARFINAMIAFAPDRLPPFSNLAIRSKITFPFSDVILSNSAAGLRAFKVPADKGTFIHNGFDINRINNLENPDVIRKAYKIETKFVVGMVGAFSDRKDYHTFLSVARELILKEYPITFIAIGTGPNLEACKASVEDLNSNRIVFTGLQEQIESIVNIFDIGVLTTNQAIHGEGISNAILEYMALGKPVIATKGGGNGELIVDSETGFLIPSHDTNALISKITGLTENQNLMLEMGRKGKERIIASFSLEKMTHQYISLYKTFQTKP